jgi:hypothetical protein
MAARSSAVPAARASSHAGRSMVSATPSPAATSPAATISAVWYLPEIGHAGMSARCERDRAGGRERRQRVAAGAPEARLRVRRARPHASLDAGGLMIADGLMFAR